MRRCLSCPVPCRVVAGRLWLVARVILSFPPLLPSPLTKFPPTSTRGLLVKTNGMHFIIYLSSLVRAIVALHGVVQNKIQFKDHVRALVEWT